MEVEAVLFVLWCLFCYFLGLFVGRQTKTPTKDTE